MSKPKAKAWVEYKEIKEKVTIEMVLNRYGLLEKLKPSGQNLVGCCPIHQGSNPRQFSINPEKNIFNCFGNCKAGGNVLNFVALMEFKDKEAESIRKAALLLKDWFLLGGADPAPEKQPDPPAAPAMAGDQGNKLVREKERTRPLRPMNL